MQVVILAAGAGTRMQPLTDRVPKPLLSVAGESLIARNIGSLPPEVDELIIVVGYRAEQVMEHLGDTFRGLRVTYVHQEEQLGTAHALSLCEKIITGRFMVLMADDLYSKEDLEDCLRHDRAWLVHHVHGEFSGGKITYDAEGHVLGVEEGTHIAEDAYVNVNMFVLTPEYFQYDYTLGEFRSHTGKTEYGLPQVVQKKAEDYPIKMVEAKNWRQVSNLDDFKSLDAHFMLSE